MMTCRSNLWVTSGRVEIPTTVAFRSGAVLTVLGSMITDPTYGAPVKLLANIMSRLQHSAPAIWRTSRAGC